MAAVVLLSEVWAGDIVPDDAINISDIMQVAKHFNSANQDVDFNHDGVINMSDIMIVSKHFNSTPNDYLEQSFYTGLTYQP